MGLTEKRILGGRRNGKAHSAGWASRESAFWMGDVTEKRILQVGPHGEAHSAHWASRKSALWPRPQSAPHQKAHSVREQSRRVRLSVRDGARVRFSVECAFPHLRKRGATSRKSAFCRLGLTEKRTLPITSSALEAALGYTHPGYTHQKSRAIRRRCPPVQSS